MNTVFRVRKDSIALDALSSFLVTLQLEVSKLWPWAKCSQWPFFYC